MTKAFNRVLREMQNLVHIYSVYTLRARVNTRNKRKGPHISIRSGRNLERRKLRVKKKHSPWSERKKKNFLFFFRRSHALSLRSLIAKASRVFFLVSAKPRGLKSYVTEDFFCTRACAVFNPPEFFFHFKLVVRGGKKKSYSEACERHVVSEIFSRKKSLFFLFLLSLCAFGQWHNYQRVRQWLYKSHHAFGLRYCTLSTNF